MRSSPVVAALIVGTSVLAACTSSTIGLVPISPDQGQTVSPGGIVVEWEPTTETADDVYYQLLIQDESGASVYEQAELRETRHVVTTSLAPGHYEWSVRPMYLRNGTWRPGTWSQRKWGKFFLVFAEAGKGPHEFNVK